MDIMPSSEGKGHEVQTSHSSVIKKIPLGWVREGSGRVRDIPEASIGKRWGQEEGASGFVDAEFEGHTASKLVSLIVRSNVGSIDATFHIHLHIWGHIQELHSHQGLCVVHLGQRKRVSPGT